MAWAVQQMVSSRQVLQATFGSYRGCCLLMGLLCASFPASVVQSVQGTTLGGNPELKRWTRRELLGLIDGYIDFYQDNTGDDGVVRSSRIWCAETNATYDLAMMQAYRYTMDKGPQRADAVLKILDFTAEKYSPPGSGWDPLPPDFQRYFQLYRAANAYLWVRDYPGISPRQHQRYKRLFVRNADGLLQDDRLDLHATVMTGNQVSPGMACLGITAKLYPDHPHADRWLRKARQVERQFLKFRRDPEGSSGYSGLGNRYWMRFDELVNDPPKITPAMLRDLADYYLALIEPDGRMAEVGEADQYEGFTHAAELMRAATRLGEGRYLYGIDMLLMDPDRAFRECGYFCYGILDAYRWCNSPPARKTPPTGLTIIPYQPPPDPQFGQWHGADVITYRSDWGRRATYVLQNLSFLSHGQDAVNAILSLFAHGTRWVSDSGYHRSGPADHCGVIARLYTADPNIRWASRRIREYTIGKRNNSRYELAWGFGKPVFDYFLGEPMAKFPGSLRQAGTVEVYCQAVRLHFWLSKPCEVRLVLSLLAQPRAKDLKISINGTALTSYEETLSDDGAVRERVHRVAAKYCKAGRNILMIGPGDAVAFDCVTLAGENLLQLVHPAIPGHRLSSPEYLQTCKSIGQSIPKYVGAKVAAAGESPTAVMWQSIAPTDIYCYFAGNPGPHTRTVIMNKEPLFWVIIDRVAEAGIQRDHPEVGLQVLHSWFINGAFDAGSNFCVVHQGGERFLWATPSAFTLVFERDEGYFWSPRVAVRALTAGPGPSRLVSLLMPLGRKKTLSNRRIDSLHLDPNGEYYSQPDQVWWIVQSLKELQGSAGGVAVRFRLGDNEYLAGAGFGNGVQRFGERVRTDARAFLVLITPEGKARVDSIGGSQLEICQ